MRMNGIGNFLEISDQVDFLSENILLLPGFIIANHSK